MRYKAKLLAGNPLFLTLVLFAASLFLVNPLGEFTVNDDWIFSRQILAFRLGIWKMSSLMDPIFISQGVVGYIWSLVFGYSHTSLRLLTILITMISAFGLYRIFRLFDLKRTPIFILLSVYLFNPLVYTSSLSFMTENYFLLFLIWNIYYYLKYIKEEKRRDLVIGTIFCALATLVRQVGIFSFVAIFILKPKKTLNWQNILIAGTAFLLFILFPRYSENESFALSGSLSNFAGTGAISSRFSLFPFFLTYLGYFLLPVLFWAQKEHFSKSKARFLFVIPLIVFITIVIFEFDVFPIGSVLYLEGLHLKSWAFENFSVFDNVFFKFGLSFLISISTIFFIGAVAKIARRGLSVESKFLILTAVLNLLILLFSSDLYDRYLLPGFTILLIFLALNLEYSEKTVRAFISLSVLVVVTLILQFNFFQITKLSWKQASAISEKYEITTDIFVLGPYRMYTHALNSKDFAGYDKVPPGEYKCFVQPFTVDTDSKTLSFLEGAQELVERKIIENPGIYWGRKPGGVARLKNHLNELDFKDEYFSPLYNLVGKKAYVGSFCVFED